MSTRIALIRNTHRSRPALRNGGDDVSLWDVLDWVLEAKANAIASAQQAQHNEAIAEERGYALPSQGRGTSVITYDLPTCRMILALNGEQLANLFGCDSQRVATIRHSARKALARLL